MAKEIEATRLAMNAVTEAKPAERRQRLEALYAASVALRDLTTRYHDWLMKEDAWLDEHAEEYPPNDPGFLKREEKYIRDVMAYQEAMDVLSAAYEMVRDESRSVSVPRPKVKQGVWRQLGEAPF